MSRHWNPRRASIKSTVLLLAFVLMASSVTVAQAGWSSVLLGHGNGSASSDTDAQPQRCKKNKKNKKKKCKPSPSPSPSPTSSASPTASPTGSASPSPSPSGSGGSKPVSGRVVEWNYTCPCSGSLTLGDPVPLENFGGGVLPIEAGEMYLSAVVNDGSGGAVPVNIDQGSGVNVQRFCGATVEPILLTEPGVEVRVFIGNMHGYRTGPPPSSTGSPCPVVAEGGSITFTLSATP